MEKMNQISNQVKIKNFIIFLVGDKSFHDDSHMLQMEKIAHLVLNKCNITSSKSDNNNISLTSRQGKLMITKGLTVEEFEKKIQKKAERD